MARYVGTYHGIKAKRPLIPMLVYAYDTTIEGRRFSTTGEDGILPSVWLANTVSSPVACTLTNIKPRVMRLFTTTTTYLQAIQPFLEGTYEYLTLIQELNQNVSIVRVEFLGELIKGNWLRWLLTHNQ